MRLSQALYSAIFTPSGRNTGRALSTALRKTATGLALTAVALPTATIAALVLSSRDSEASSIEILKAVPRTTRAISWGAWAARSYTAALALPVPEMRAAAIAKLDKEGADKLLHLCQTNGGVYIKAGQLGVALKALPPRYCQVLEALQDNVPARPLSDVDCVLKEEFSKKSDELFEEFEPQATAAASLAQVHKARLKSGQTVAVKVQHRGLESAIAADLTTLSALAAAGYFLFGKKSDWRFLISQLQEKLKIELDFEIEAQNAKQCRHNFRNRQDVYVPTTIDHLSTKSVITMEWATMNACKVNDTDGIRAAGMDPREVGLLLFETFAQQQFVDGFVHGDPHSGNIFVRPQLQHSGWQWWLLRRARKKPQLILLDHGFYIRLNNELRRNLCLLWSSFVVVDPDIAKEAATKLGGPMAGNILPAILKPRDWSAMTHQEKVEMREQSGITGMSDLEKVLKDAPEALLDTLRTSAVVRVTCHKLGANITDRLLINARQAYKGLYKDGTDIYDGVWKWKLKFGLTKLWVLSLYGWLRAVWG